MQHTAVTTPPRRYPRSCPWPPNPIERTTMPNIVNMPTRANAITYEANEVQEVADLLGQVNPGQGIALDDRLDSETKARSRAQVMQALLKRDHGLEVKAHVVVTAVTGKDDTPSEFAPVVSLKRSANGTAAA